MSQHHVFFLHHLAHHHEEDLQPKDTKNKINLTRVLVVFVDEQKINRKV